MAKRDIMELQKRMRPEEHNITWVVTALIEPDGTVASVNKERHRWKVCSEGQGVGHGSAGVCIYMAELHRSERKRGRSDHIHEQSGESAA